VSLWALVPVKAHGAGKQRLTGVLTPAQRTRLVEVMLEHVLAALAGAGIGNILVLSPQRPALPDGIEHLPDAGQGLNAGLTLALAALTQRHAHAALVVFADLPLIAAADIEALIVASATGIALAPDEAGTGTNALALPLPGDFRLQFGPGSCERHLAEAARLGHGAQLVRRAGLAFDIDEPADLVALQARRDPRYAFLA
jgi:2-phospho-L-lactate guanylyltransferase